MRGFSRKFSKKRGLPPGTIVHTGEDRNRKVLITVMDYNDKKIDETKLATMEKCNRFENGSTVTWINIDGVHDTKIIEDFGKYMSIHPLVLEDIASTDQRPKVEDFEEYVFVVVKMFYYVEREKKMKSEQLSIILKKNCIITFQEEQGDVFDMLRERIRKDKGSIRKKRTDYLLYSILDAVIDNYFVVLERFGLDMEDLELDLTKKPSTKTLMKIHSLKHDIIFVRKAVWPLREVVNTLIRNESKLMQPTTMRYMRDLYDHSIQVIDNIEALRDITSSMVEVYLSSISNRMNEIMKVLTIISTIFIPLTFITGLYGMNFKFMPELEQVYGYPTVLVVMVILSISMYLYFRKKEWM
ncbi:magnesium/cobalt transporter CorA [Candidatus Micrarchaeota archaeon]|nr:magnesium/cobalt transporter CorA [Candidatus Micrarchaeota archaeon]MBU1165915.1 magnesium/cobalt transporter CorA [Candidatus Micrarchaeota archaeon]MBU1886958.1 magnesium/cobalt transporter CorA [Candidatus Micrarchaeota archaeon]